MQLSEDHVPMVEACEYETLMMSLYVLTFQHDRVPMSQRLPLLTSFRSFFSFLATVDSIRWTKIRFSVFLSFPNKKNNKTHNKMSGIAGHTNHYKTGVRVGNWVCLDIYIILYN